MISTPRGGEPSPVRVLLIEDSKGDARLLREDLEISTTPFEVTHVLRLDEGLARLEQSPFDLLLLDLHLPDSQGFATFEAAVQRAPGIPIVVLSGLSDERTGAQAVQNGAQDYLVKGQIPPGLLERTLRYAMERSRSSAALRSSEERYRQFFEEDLAGAFIATPDGAMLACNPAFARMFGFDTVEAATARSVGSYFPNVDEAVAMREAIRVGKKLVDHALPLRRADGTPIHTIGNLIGGFSPGGDLQEIKGYLFDDSERRQLEEELRQSQKMESIGRLAGGVAHDFNNLLTVILGYADTVLEQCEPSDPRRADVEEIRVAGLRAAALTQQLLAFSRRQVLQVRVIDLTDVILHLKRMLTRVLGETVDLVTTLSPNGHVKADATQIEQVLINLALNARDAMPEGGTLTIATRPLRILPDAARKPSGPPPGEYIELSVTDTGHGIEPDVLPKLFEPFFTTKKSGRGTGLGLATVYGIVKQSNGEISVETQIGKGTTFRVHLPLSRESVPEGAREDSTGTDSGGAETILLVEDESAVRFIASRLLRSKGYSVIEAVNGPDALDQSGRHSGVIDLLITDLVMPRMSGREFSEQFLRLRPGTPVLFISGYTDDDVVRDLIARGGAAFLQKPFEPEALARTARRLLDGPRAPSPLVGASSSGD